MADNNEQIELADLLSETMKATIEADRQASEKYYEVLRSYAFKSASDGEETATQAGAQALEMVSFRIGNGDMRQEVSIPKLSLMPLPLLHIEEASFELNGEMSSTMEEKKQSMQKPVKKGPVLRYRLLGTRLPSSGTTTQTGTNNTATNVRITVKMRQGDLPNGLVQMLQAVGNSMNVKKINDKTKEEK